MIASTQRTNLVITMSFVVAIMLTIFPLPDWANPWRPAWVVTVLIYWCMAVPNKVGITTAWFLGLILDIQQGALLGQNALGLTLIAFFTIQSYQRLRMSPLTQQAVIVCFYILFYKLIMLLVMGYIGVGGQDWTYWMSAIVSMLLWPWIFIILRDLRRQYDIT